MATPSPWNEPPVDPLDDTHPTLTVPLVNPHDDEDRPLPAWRWWTGLISLIGAAALTAAAALLLLSGDSPAGTTAANVAAQPNADASAQSAGAATAVNTPTQQAQIGSLAPAPAGAPTLAPDAAASLLNAPVEAVVVPIGGGEPPQVVVNRSDPFTTIPDRPRDRVIQYSVQQGDTVSSIAERYGLQPETIAWSNPASVTFNLQPGDSLNILPVDGVYHQASGFETLAEIAAKYKIDDPFVVLDSPFNLGLGDVTPDTILPPGTWVVVPGGEGLAITWTQRIVETSGAGGAASTGGGQASQPQTVSFAPGESGSCPPQAVSGGTAWVNPLPNGTWMRGFTAWHTGVDLAAPVGTPVRAANGGRVIFSGWNSFGYGYAVVLVHGPYIMTLYGHMSEIYVSCGQDVNAGDIIGAVGSTGNSSGPHLHFEILGRQANGGWVPTDPTSVLGF